MSESASREGAATADQPLGELVGRERGRLAAFIRRRVADPLDAEDVLQDVFAAFIDANRRLMPIEHVTAWLYRAARNRIVDLFRKKTPERFDDHAPRDDEGEAQSIDDLLPSPDDGPEALALRQALIDALEAALDELPPEQRDVFLWHELEGRTFAEMAATTGVSINTLLARKRYAVRRLRARLQDLIDDYDDQELP
jgi:RNA polymerase sigma factor (sigma-70 family)